MHLQVYNISEHVLLAFSSMKRRKVGEASTNFVLHAQKPIKKVTNSCKFPFAAAIHSR